MRRSISFHEAPASTNEWLFRLIIVLGTLVLALALAASALGATAYYSFDGAFTNSTETPYGTQTSAIMPLGSGTVTTKTLSTGGEEIPERATLLALHAAILMEPCSLRAAVQRPPS